METSFVGTNNCEAKRVTVEASTLDLGVEDGTGNFRQRADVAVATSLPGQSEDDSARSASLPTCRS